MSKKTKANTDREEKQSKPSCRNWFAICIILLVISILYSNSLHSPFVLDDIYKIVKNPDITRLNNITTKLIYPYSDNKTFERNDPSRPLTSFTFILNYHFGKLDPFGYHLFNIFLHILNTILVFILIKTIIFYLFCHCDPAKAGVAISSVKTNKDSHGRTNPNRDSLGMTNIVYILPLLAALLFGAAPINAYSVVYTYCRSDLLATFFYMLAVLLFIKSSGNIRHATTGEMPYPNKIGIKAGKKLYLLSLLSFVLALAAKQYAVTLPAIILVVDYTLLSDLQLKNVIKKKSSHIPFWALLFLYLLFRYIYLGGIGDLEAKSTWSRYSYIITQPYIILKYFQLMLFPAGLCFDHYIGPSRLTEIKTIVSFIIIISIFVYMYLLNRKKDGVSKIVTLCVLWFFITISPTSSILPTTAMLGENRIYLPGFGFYLLVVFIFFLIFSKAEDFGYQKNKSPVVLLSIYLIVMGITTIKRNVLFRNDILLWEDVISRYPAHFRAHNNLGNLYKEMGDNNKAIQEFQKSVETGPEYYIAYDNLGVLYRELKEYDKAITVFQKALELSPDYAVSHNNLGVLYKDRGEYDKAIQEFQKAVDINPNYIDAHNNLGNLLATRKEYSGAVQEFQKTLELNPDYAVVHFNLGILYSEQNKYEEAILEFSRFLETNPDNISAMSYLAKMYYLKKDYDNSLRVLERMLELKPNDAGITDKIIMIKKLKKGA